MTVLPHNSSTLPTLALPTELQVNWQAMREDADGVAKSISISALAHHDGSIVVEIESDLEASEIRAFTTTCTATSISQKGAVMTWQIGSERLLRVSIAEDGEIQAIRSSIPTKLGLSGGTYCLQR